MNSNNININALPRKCYACSTCKKFKESDDPKVCRLCEHHYNYHEQVNKFLICNHLITIVFISKALFLSILLYNNILIIIVDFIKFSDLLFRQEKLTGNLLGLKRLPKKCYKCN